MEARSKTLVLGFYDRSNAGDESYKITIPDFIEKPIFVSMDECEKTMKLKK